MATYNVSVKKALPPSQQDLIDHKEHCSADPVKLATVGRERGHQVRIRRNDTEYGLYTVARCLEPFAMVWIGQGMKRGRGRDFAFTLVKHNTTRCHYLPSRACRGAHFYVKRQRRLHYTMLERLEHSGHQNRLRHLCTLQNPLKQGLNRKLMHSIIRRCRCVFGSMRSNSGVEFVAVDNPHANKLTLHILAAVAQHEREMIAQRDPAVSQ